MRRFIAWRGKPTVIDSDNRTNFVGANRGLHDCIREWNTDNIENTLRQEGIERVFNPPAASHMGCLWERLVRSSEKALSAVLQKQVLTDEVLSTTFVEVEWFPNSRPLTELNSNVQDLDALIPSHFILGRRSVKILPGIFVNKEMWSQKRWKQSQILARHAWIRWLRK